MKWIGQHIYDLTSRFRSDIYLESISTGTIASGAHLGLDSNNKVVKAVDGGGDLTAIVAGTGLSGTDLSGPIPTLNVDTELSHVVAVGTIDTGVWRGDTITTTYTDAKVTSVVAGDGIDVSGATGDVTVTAETASDTNPGIVELATSAETNTGTDAGRAVTPDGLEDWEGSAQVTTLGTIATGAWNGTKVASAYLDDDTAHLAGTQTFTGTKTLNSFKGTAGATVTNILDEDAMGSDSATALATQQSIKAYVDTKYAYSYITLSASAKPTKDGSDNPEWMVPNINKGIYEEDWNKDTGITSTTVGATAYALGRYTAVNSFIIPHAGILVGFHAIGRNGTADRTFKAGLFHADNGLGGAGADGSAGEGIDYGRTGSDHEFSLRCVATALETDASGGADGTTSHDFRGPCQLISNTISLQLQAGDALMPAIMGNSVGATDEIFVSMTIILKIPIA